MLQAHNVIIAAARKIINASRAQRQLLEAAGAQAAPASAAAGSLNGSSTALVKGPGRGVLPGSFVVQLEAWKSKYEGEEGVTDDLVGAGFWSAGLAVCVTEGGPCD